MSNQDTIIVLAFPETNVIKVDMWYDTFAKALGIIKNGYYVAGHAAAILVERNTGNTHYFDFGRYHTPPKHGRIRDSETDPELQMKSVGKFCEIGNLLNPLELIGELAQKGASHGDGKLVYSVYKGIDFKKAYVFAKKWQAEGVIPYGPFELHGTNCSRFVASLVKAGKPDFLTNMKLSIPRYTTATPMGNVNNTNKQNTKSIFIDNVNAPTRNVAKRNQNRTLFKPERPNNISEYAQWLSGEGAGSWFEINKEEEFYVISRYSPKGVLEFEKKFVTSSDFNIAMDYEFSYVSNAIECNLIQNGEKLKLVSIC